MAGASRPTAPFAADADEGVDAPRRSLCPGLSRMPGMTLRGPCHRSEPIRVGKRVFQEGASPPPAVAAVTDNDSPRPNLESLMPFLTFLAYHYSCISPIY